MRRLALASPLVILMIEDDPDMALAIRELLGSDARILHAKNAQEAKQILSLGEIHLVLLDLTLPDGDGFKLCAGIRGSEHLRRIPVIFLTGSSDIEDKVVAFSLGADDYIEKPFDSREFHARILARLTRLKSDWETSEVFLVGDLQLVIPMQKIYLLKNSGPVVIDCTPLEFRLLHLLGKHEERIFPRDELIDRIWGTEIHVLERTVDSHISDLRKKLKESLLLIECVRGEGYRLCRRGSGRKRAA